MKLVCCGTKKSDLRELNKLFRLIKALDCEKYILNFEYKMSSFSSKEQTKPR